MELYEIFAYAAVMIILQVYLIRRKKRQAETRIESKKQLAKKLNCEFVAEPESVEWAALAQANFIQGQKESTIVELLISRSEEKYYYFVHQYIVHYSNSSRKRTRRQGVILLPDNDWIETDFKLRPETFLDFLAPKKEWQDIDFDDHPKFSKKYVLHAENPEWAKKIFNPKLLDCILSKYPVAIECSHGNLYFWYELQELEEQKFLDLLDFGRQFQSMLRSRVERHEMFG